MTILTHDEKGNRIVIPISKKKSPIIWPFVFVIFLCILTTGSYVFFSSSKPEQESWNFVTSTFIPTATLPTSIPSAVGHESILVFSATEPISTQTPSEIPPTGTPLPPRATGTIIPDTLAPTVTKHILESVSDGQAEQVLAWLKVTEQSIKLNRQSNNVLETQIALIQKKADWTLTPTPKPTTIPIPTINPETAEKLANAQANREHQQAITEQVKQKAIIITGAIIVLIDAFIVIMFARKLYNAKRESYPQQAEEPTPVEPVFNPPVTQYQFGRIRYLIRTRTGISRRQIEQDKDVFGYSNGDAGKAVQSVLNYFRQCPSPSESSYNDYVRYSSRMSQMSQVAEYQEEDQ